MLGVPLSEEAGDELDEAPGNELDQALGDELDADGSVGGGRGAEAPPHKRGWLSDDDIEEFSE